MTDDGEDSSAVSHSDDSVLKESEAKIRARKHAADRGASSSSSSSSSSSEEESTGKPKAKPVPPPNPEALTPENPEALTPEENMIVLNTTATPLTPGDGLTPGLHQGWNPLPPLRTPTPSQMSQGSLLYQGTHQAATPLPNQWTEANNWSPQATQMSVKTLGSLTGTASRAAYP